METTAIPSLPANTTSDFIPRPLNVPGLVSLLFFYLVILALGVWASWKNRAWKSSNVEDVMLAGRKTTMFIGIYSMTATWVGGGMINGTAEYVFRPESGLAGTQVMWGFSLSLLINGLFFAHKMRRSRYVTLLDPFEEKYGKLFAGLMYIPIFSGDLFWSGAVLSALGATLVVILGISHVTGVLVSAGIATLYTVVGGLYSVIITDIFQLSFIFFGLWLAFGFSATNPHVKDIASTALGADGWIGELKPDVGVLAWIDSALLIILGGLPWQAYFQRVLSAKTPRVAVQLSLVGSAGCIILTLPAVLCGAVARSANWTATDYGLYFPLPIREENYPLILPLVLEFLTPLPVAVIGLGAVSAAVMSSADSSFFAASSMFARHVWVPIKEQLTHKQVGNNELMWVMRGAVILCGALASVVAIEVRSIYALFVLCSDFVYVVAFPLFVCCIHVESSNVYGAFSGYIFTFLLRFLSGEALLGIPPLIKFPFFDEQTQLQVFPYRTLISFLGFIVIVLVSLATNWMFADGRLSRKWDFMNAFAERIKTVDDSEEMPPSESEDEKL